MLETPKAFKYYIIIINLKVKILKDVIMDNQQETKLCKTRVGSSETIREAPIFLYILNKLGEDIVHYTYESMYLV